MAGLGDIAGELESVARHLRAAGDGGLARELTAGMRRGVRPVPGDIRAGLEPPCRYLPDRYAAELAADVRLGVNVRTAGSDPGVSVTAVPGRDRKLRDRDEGRLTHPLFGDRGHWYTQREPSVRPGWFTGPCEAAAPRIRRELERALEDTGEKAAGGRA